MNAYDALPRAKPEDVGMSSERLERVKLAARRHVDEGSTPHSSVRRLSLSAPRCSASRSSSG